MKRKYNFKWSGYKYAPETIGFSLNGKHLNLPEETRSNLAYLAICGRNKEVIEELKRIVRAEEKKPIIKGKCICFFAENSDKYYYTQQLLYNSDDIYDALRAYKEWKRYIKSKNCILDEPIAIAEGTFNPCGVNKPIETRTECNKIDLKHYRSVSIIRRSIY